MGSIQPETETNQSEHIILKDPTSRIVGLNADPDCSKLLGACTRKDLTPRLGTELGDVQLRDLTDDQVEELARFISQRGCVVFRNQDWTDFEQEALGAKLGVLEKADRAREGCPQSMSYNRTDENSSDAPGEEFHSDLIFEEIPPAYIMLHCSTCPPNGGGDTAFANMYAAYDKLSPPMKEFLRGKTGVNKRPIYAYNRNDAGRPSVNAHPIVRTHPVTGWNALFMSESRTTHIEGLSVRESIGIIQLLVKHIEKSLELHTRVHWEPNTVAIWDNRIVMHSAIWDYYPETRECRKVTIHGGEKPFFDPNGGSQTDAFVGGAKGKLPPAWTRHGGLKKSTMK